MPFTNAASAGEVFSGWPHTVACPRAPVSRAQRTASSDTGSSVPASAPPIVSTISASRAPSRTLGGMSRASVFDDEGGEVVGEHGDPRGNWGIREHTASYPCHCDAPISDAVAQDSHG